MTDDELLALARKAAQKVIDAYAIAGPVLQDDHDRLAMARCIERHNAEVDALKADVADMDAIADELRAEVEQMRNDRDLAYDKLARKGAEVERLRGCLSAYETRVPLAAGHMAKMPKPTGDYETDLLAIAEALTDDMRPAGPPTWGFVQWEIAPPDDVGALFSLEAGLRAEVERLTRERDAAEATALTNENAGRDAVEGAARLLERAEAAESALAAVTRERDEARRESEHWQDMADHNQSALAAAQKRVDQYEIALRSIAAYTSSQWTRDTARAALAAPGERVTQQQRGKDA